MSGINNFLDTVVADLKAKLPDLKSCEKHPGQFTVSELGKISTRSPAFRLAPYELVKVEKADGGEVDYTCAFSLAVITTDKKGLPREEASVNLAEQLGRVLAKGETWGVDYAFPPSNITARNLYGGELGKMRVQLWEIRWRQTLRLGAPDWQAEVAVMPSKLYVGLAPDIGEGHEDDYILISTGEGHG